MAPDRLGTSVRLVSRVGDDAFGRLVLAETAAAGVDVGGVHTDAARTATLTQCRSSSSRPAILPTWSDTTCTKSSMSKALKNSRRTVRGGIIFEKGSRTS